MCVSIAGLVDLFVAEVQLMPSAFHMITIPVCFQRLNAEPDI